MQNSTTIPTVQDDTHALKIAKDLINAFNSFYPQNFYHILKNHPYSFTWNDRFFEITLYDSPSDCKYISKMYDYSHYKYCFCKICEKRANGQIKFILFFGFDFSKMFLLELFDIYHSNIRGEFRKYLTENIRREFILIPFAKNNA